MNRTGRTYPLLEIHGAVLLFGLAGLFGKWLAVSPLIIVLGRVVFASLALGLVLLVRGGPRRRISRGDQWLFAGLGILLAGHWTLFFLSVQVSTVAVGLLAYSSFPVFTAFLEPALSKKRLDSYSLFFSGLCGLGIFLIIPRFSWTESVFRGVILGLGAGLTFALLSVLNRRLTARYDSVVIAFRQDAIAALVLLPTLFIIRPVLSAGDIGLLAMLGIVCTAGAHTLFIDGMRIIPALTASIIASLEPVYGIVLALAFLGEAPSARTLLGGAVILAAATAISLRAIRPAND
ncbi:MAG: DMT family transporter [Candidatus Aminicenantes bacterium]|nr:DMT family transporter [Candidatus Aminicenantes bacterium]